MTVRYNPTRVNPEEERRLRLSFSLAQKKEEYFFCVGVHFDTSSDRLLNEISTAIKVYAHGVEDFVSDYNNREYSLNTQLSCEGVGDSRWSTGDKFYK
ncbi:unnamed protein product [Nezara viridula]|uniref:Uncharacterized protein n=1 Tax=Nezara viridula TaxID=85310 RepID=A0A9P0HDS7_NEZVI|nr:unnamed protein product [Nezara viridula]